MGGLIRANTLHRNVLAAKNDGINADHRFGDLARMPWWRQPDDDVLPTAGAMLTELHRLDARGIVGDRAVEHKIIVTCRFVAILMASALKAKGIPARVRAGHAGYFGEHPQLGEVVAYDHWIVEYWHEGDGRWVQVDVDGSLTHVGEFDAYDMPDGTFHFAARAWLDSRHHGADPDYFFNASGARGLRVVAWSLFYDFHSLMNDENIYLHIPAPVGPEEFDKLTKEQLAELDALAELLLDPDANFSRLQRLYETRREWRLLAGALLSV